MAPPPLRRTALLLLMALLLLFVVAHARAVRDQAAVPAVATSRGHAEAELHGQRTEVDSKEEAKRFKAAAEENPCVGGGGGAGEEGEADQEECLMRRTLEAHTDYIYTQSGGHS